MDAAVLVSLLALVVSVMTLGASWILVSRQVRQMRNANQIPAVIDLMTEFRNVELHDRFERVCSQLPNTDCTYGLAGLPPEMRKDVLSIAYYFQTFASLIGLGVLDERDASNATHPIHQSLGRNSAGRRS